MLPQHPHNAGLFCCVVGGGTGWGGIRLDTCGYFKTKNSRHFLFLIDLSF